MKNCDICANDTFRESWCEAGVAPKAFHPPRFSPAGGNGSAAAGASPDQEALIQSITDRVMAALNGRA